MYIKLTGIEGLSSTGPHWLKRMGLAGFLFFFLKGMLWLLIPWLVHSAMLWPLFSPKWYLRDYKENSRAV